MGFPPHKIWMTPPCCFSEDPWTSGCLPRRGREPPPPRHFIALASFYLLLILLSFLRFLRASQSCYCCYCCYLLGGIMTLTLPNPRNSIPSINLQQHQPFLPLMEIQWHNDFEKIGVTEAAFHLIPDRGSLAQKNPPKKTHYLHTVGGAVCKKRKRKYRRILHPKMIAIVQMSFWGGGNNSQNCKAVQKRKTDEYMLEKWIYVWGEKTLHLRLFGLRQTKDFMSSYPSI